MTENDTQMPETQDIPPFANPEDEPSLADKLVGVISSPSATFGKMAKYQPKAVDWLIPVIIMIAVSFVSTFMMYSSPEIKQQLKEFGLDQAEQSIDKQVEAGFLTKEQADSAMDAAYAQVEKQFEAGPIMNMIGVVIWAFLQVFLLGLVWFILARFILRGEGSYSSALSVYGLATLITSIQLLVILLITMIAGKFIMGTSVAAVMGSEPGDFTFFITSKLDPLRIWFYWVLGLGLAKMYRSENSTKFIIAVFATWLGFGLILFALAQAVPFLSFLTMM